MISLFTNLLRFIITLCIIVTAIFVIACVALVIYFALKGNIKIRTINENEKCNNEWHSIFKCRSIR